jgi:serine/threonine-protein kinase ULK/ATG1
MKCLKELDSPHMVRLIEHHQDEKWLCFIMEYCDLGDLLILQSQQKDMVFPLERAVQILADVIRGLEDLHQMGYLHRDIKSQNVLVKS